MIWSIPIGNGGQDFYDFGIRLKNKKFCVYVHLFPNGKRYIGITSKRPKARWESGTGYKEGSPIRNAINKYGWDNIEHIILFEGLTQEEACDKEIELIAKYKTNIYRYGNEYGYNMTDGGEGTVGHKLSEENIEKMRQRLLGKTGKDCPNSRVVVCDGIEYESLTDFKIKNNYPKGNIQAWLNGVVGMPKEWYDRGLHYKDLGFGVVKLTNKKNRTRKVVANGIVFATLDDCAKYFSTSASAICCYLSGKKSAPKEIIDANLRYEDEEHHEFKPWTRKSKTKVKCEIDGIQFDTQADLARYINENKGTLWAWLSGRNPIPEKYKERGLKIIE